MAKAKWTFGSGDCDAGTRYAAGQIRASLPRPWENRTPADLVIADQMQHILGEPFIRPTEKNVRRFDALVKALNGES